MPATATIVKPQPDPAAFVRAEFRGKARTLRARITTTYGDFDAGVETLLSPFRGQNRSPLSRKTLLRRMAKDWRALPPFGQLRLKIGPADDGLAIDEIRCAPTALLQVDWTDPEAAVAIILVSVRVEPRGVKDRVRPLAVVGLHALGRAYQRSGGNDIAILKLLVPLVTAWPRVIRQPGDFAIPAGAGIWRGEVIPLTINAEAMTMMSVRTFVSEAA